LAWGVLAAALPAAGAAASDVRPTFNLQVANNVLLAADPVASPALEETLEDKANPTGLDDLSDEDLGDLLDVGQDAENIDPLEDINRPIFEFNLVLDRWVLRPVTRIYIETVPDEGREGIANVLQNVKSPVIFANDLLQGEMSRAGATLGRFFINTIFGLGGLIDTAAYLDLPGHDEDFGQTLAVYGVGGYPYLVIPFFGPSNPRDFAGDLVDTGIDPLTYYTPDELRVVRTGLGLISDRAAILDESVAMEATSLDFYSAVRSFYYQHRDYEISNDSKAAAPRMAPQSSFRTTRGPALDRDVYGALEYKASLD
jgi:phospholipid-binding lipoprotein MlaA